MALEELNDSTTLSRFTGSNPVRWLFEVERFFYLYKIYEEDRFAYVVEYFDDEPFSWFNSWYRGPENLTWKSFTIAMLHRFPTTTASNYGSPPPPSPTSTPNQFAPSSTSTLAPILTNQFKPSTITFVPTTKPSLPLHISTPIPASTLGESVIPKFGHVQMSKGCLFRSKVAMGSESGNQLVPDVVVTTTVSGQVSHGEAKGIGWVLNEFSCTFAPSQMQWQLKMKDKPWLYYVAGRCDWHPPWPSTLAPSNVVVRLEWRPSWRYIETVPNIIVRLEWRPLGRYATTKPNAIGRREWRPPWKNRFVLEDKNVLKSAGIDTCINHFHYPRCHALTHYPSSIYVGSQCTFPFPN